MNNTTRTPHDNDWNALSANALHALDAITSTVKAARFQRDSLTGSYHLRGIDCTPYRLNQNGHAVSVTARLAPSEYSMLVATGFLNDDGTLA